MKALVLGVNGMAGHMIALQFVNAGHDVLGFARQAGMVREVETVVGDALGRESLIELVRRTKPDLLINCLGVLNHAAEVRQSEAVYVNSYLPHLLADLVGETGGCLVHLSTDCVYSGEDGPYTADRPANARSMYGRSKALGEPSGDAVLVVRTSIVGPDLHSDGIGLFNWFMRQSGVVRGYSRAWWNGVTTLQLASTLLELGDETRGLIHLVPEESISKLDLLRVFADIFPEAGVKVDVADTPFSNKVLVPNSSLSTGIPDYQAMVRSLRSWIEAHRSLYTHYRL